MQTDKNHNKKEELKELENIGMSIAKYCLTGIISCDV